MHLGLHSHDASSYSQALLLSVSKHDVYSSHQHRMRPDTGKEELNNKYSRCSQQAQVVVAQQRHANGLTSIKLQFNLKLATATKLHLQGMFAHTVHNKITT
jgi:hypothetical protein